MTTTPTDYTVTAAGQMVLDQIAHILQRGTKAATAVTDDIAKNGLTHAIAWGEAEVVDAYMAEHVRHLADYIAREPRNDATLLACLTEVRAQWANDVLSNYYRGNSTGELHRATSNLEREAVCRLIRELDGAIAYLTTTLAPGERVAARARTAEEDADRLAKALAFHPLNDQICDEALDAHAVAKAKR